MKRRDIAGEKYGRLTATSMAPSRRDSDGAIRAYWNCVCECGTTIVVMQKSLTTGNTKSCGCLQREVATRRCTTHGLSGTRSHRIWEGMLTRCYNEHHHSYQYYGARGITVCHRWRVSFEAFFEDMGEAPEGMSLDRIDNSKGYGPENCRWATHRQQMNNTSRNRTLTLGGDTATVSQWSRRTGIPLQTLLRRIRSGWTTERVLTQVVRSKYAAIMSRQAK